MSESSLEQLRRGSIQLLELYRRCGVGCVPKPTDRWSASWDTVPLDRAEGLAAPPLASSATTPSIADVRSPIAAATPALLDGQPAQARSPLGDAVARPPSRTVAGSPELPLPGGSTPWPRPNLPVVERASLLDQLRDEVQRCQKCSELAAKRTQTVFGVGKLNPRVVFFGEAPGADEDRKGEPFVGAAGQLLNRILEASKIQREDVYILNSLKCRPPGNRTPLDEEIAHCRPFFETQLEILQPEFIVCLGSVASRAVLHATESIGRLRGRFYAYRQAKVLVTYHPAYLLRNEGAKRLVWEDMKMLMRALGIAPSEKKS